MLENNITKRETSSIYEDDGRKFKINSYDPIEGNYILVQIMNFVMPLGLSKLLEKQLGSETSLPSIGENKMMPKNDFLQLERDILGTIEEVYSSGNTSPVIRENGTFGIDNVTMALTIKLMIASLAFNFKSFFEEVPSLREFLAQ